MRAAALHGPRAGGVPQALVPPGDAETHNKLAVLP
jgi:hypothetical protein